MKPHKHAELIKAWADGKTIQYRVNKKFDWCEISNNGVIGWYGDLEYRIKPEPKPDVVRYVDVSPLGDWSLSIDRNKINNLKLTWDGETGKLKSAEVL